MPSNFSPHVPVKTSTYQNRGADYWLYGPQLKAKAQGLGLQMAGKMRSDITGIHEADMPYVKQLTDRVSRKREEYTNKLLDGADINDQLIKSMVGTFNENKDIQGSIKEAKINNQKIEQYKSWAFESGVKSGDPQYYNQWMDDSLKSWGGTFSEGGVKAFEMDKNTPGYVDIPQEFDTMLKGVKDMFTEDELAIVGDRAGLEIQNVPGLGMQLFWNIKNPDVKISNAAKIQEAVDAFNKRLVLEDNPEKGIEKGEYADFIKYRGRDDEDWFPELQTRLKDMASLASFTDIKKKQDTMRQGSFIDNASLGIGTTTEGPTTFGEPSKSSYVRGEMRDESTPFTEFDFGQAGIETFDYVPGKGVTINPGSKSEGTATAINDYLTDVTTKMQSMLGNNFNANSVSRILTNNTTGVRKNNTAFANWFQDLKEGSSLRDDANDILSTIEDMKKFGIENLNITRSDMEFAALYDKYGGFSSTSDLEVDADGNPVRLDSDAYKLRQNIEANKGHKLFGKDLDREIDRRQAEYEKKVNLIKEFEGLREEFFENTAITSDTRVSMTWEKPAEERKYIQAVSDDVFSNSVMLVELGKNNDRTVVGDDIMTKLPSKGVTGGVDIKDKDNFNKMLIAASTKPGTFVNGIKINPKYSYTAEGTDPSQWIDPKKWESLGKEKQEKIRRELRYANVLSVTFKKDGAHAAKTFDIIVGSNNDTYRRPKDRSSNAFAELIFDESGKVLSKSSTVDDVLDNMKPSETRNITPSIPGDTRAGMSSALVVKRLGTNQYEVYTIDEEGRRSLLYKSKNKKETDILKNELKEYNRDFQNTVINERVKVQYQQ